jgi:hypothetical protein
MHDIYELVEEDWQQLRKAIDGNNKWYWKAYNIVTGTATTPVSLFS